jgi:hypothetical protein
MIKHPVLFCLFSSFLALAASHPACAAETHVAGAQFRYLLGFEVSAGVSMAHIQHVVGSAKTFKAGEFEEAICYYRGHTVMVLTSFHGDGDGDDAGYPDTLDMYEVTLIAEPDAENNCSPLPSKIPDAAFQPRGLKLGMSINQFEALTGATAADELQNGVKSSRVFQKFFSTAHYIYGAFDTKGLATFRVQ